MYFFDLNGLVEHLKAGKNTTRESLQYVIGFYVLTSLFEMINVSVHGKTEVKPTFEGGIVALLMVLAGAAITLAIGIWIIKYLYEANGGDEGEHYLHRTLAIGFVITCWATPIGLIFVGIMAVFKSAYVMMGLLVLLFFAASIYLLIFTARKLRYIAEGPQPESTDPSPSASFEESPS